jgi:hypothetical protein
MAEAAPTPSPIPTRYMLTTSDNPFSPFSEWDEWYAFDESKGYHSSALLARITNTSDEMSEPDQDIAINQGINDVLDMNDNGLYRKVSQETEKSDS